jgi:NAD(P)-dependent dehydrogenase (short-subunit alcohol dehydrogenase family)
MVKRLKGMVAIITGGATGIGEGTARMFAEQGASVVIADLQVERGKALVNELGSSACFVRTDVTNEQDVSRAVDLAVNRFGQLDCMINNAGIFGAVGPIQDTSVADYEITVAVLLKGVFLGMKHAARVMIPYKKGNIISVASAAAVTGGIGPHVYTAAKHGVIGFTKSVASELAQYQIRVNAVAPGGIVSDMSSEIFAGSAKEVIQSSSPLGCAGMPSDIAHAMVYLASEEARYVTGHTLVVDAGITTGGKGTRVHGMTAGIFKGAGNRTCQ